MDPQTSLQANKATFFFRVVSFMMHHARAFLTYFAGT